MIGHVIMNFEGGGEETSQMLLVNLVLRLFQSKLCLFSPSHPFHPLPADATADTGSQAQPGHLQGRAKVHPAQPCVGQWPELCAWGDDLRGINHNVSLTEPCCSLAIRRSKQQLTGEWDVIKAE